MLAGPGIRRRADAMHPPLDHDVFTPCPIFGVSRQSLGARPQQAARARGAPASGGDGMATEPRTPPRRRCQRCPCPRCPLSMSAPHRPNPWSLICGLSSFSFSRLWPQRLCPHRRHLSRRARTD